MNLRISVRLDVCASNVCVRALVCVFVCVCVIMCVCVSNVCVCVNYQFDIHHIGIPMQQWRRSVVNFWA